jgi:hypothetical protein
MSFQFFTSFESFLTNFAFEVHAIVVNQWVLFQIYLCFKPLSAIQTLERSCAIMSLNMDFQHMLSCKKFLANLAFESLFVKLMDSSRSSNFSGLDKKSPHPYKSSNSWKILDELIRLSKSKLNLEIRIWG